MRIDLLNEKGLLKSTPFVKTEAAPLAEVSTQTEDERIAETLARRHKSIAKESALPEEPEPGTEDAEGSEETPLQVPKPAEKAKTRTRDPALVAIIIFVAIAAFTYFVYGNGYLDPLIRWTNAKIGISLPTARPLHKPVAIIEQTEIEPVVKPPTTLSEQEFNALMPVTESIAALKDSLQQVSTGEIDTAVTTSQSIEMAAEVVDTSAEAIEVEITEAITEPDPEPVPEQIPVQPSIELSDQDVELLHNQSLLLLLDRSLDFPLVAENINSFKISRNSLEILTEEGEAVHAAIADVLQEFAMGELNISGGYLTSPIELVMRPVSSFMVDQRDLLGVFDVLAHPYDAYLVSINTDMEKGLRDNPATLVFQGSASNMKRILAGWSTANVNYILEDIELNKQDNTFTLTLNIRLIQYNS